MSIAVSVIPVLRDPNCCVDLYNGSVSDILCPFPTLSSPWLDYRIDIVGKCLRPTMSKGPTKDGCKKF